MLDDWTKRAEQYRNSVLHLGADTDALGELEQRVPAIDNIYSHAFYFAKVRDAVNIQDVVRSPRTHKIMPNGPKVFLDQDSNVQMLGIFSKFFDQFIPDEEGVIPTRYPQDAADVLREVFKDEIPRKLLKIQMIDSDGTLITPASLYRNALSALQKNLAKDNVISIETGEPLQVAS